MTKKKIEPFPDIGCETYQPRMVLIHTDPSPQHLGNPPNIETILIARNLTESEQNRLKQSKTPEEIHDLLYLIKEINEPTEYEIDLRSKV